MGVKKEEDDLVDVGLEYFFLVSDFFFYMGGLAVVGLFLYKEQVWEFVN